jgi:two-component system response regulator ResD
MARRILIVEPDRRVAEEIYNLFHFERGRFEREHYELEVAESVTEAIEQVEAVDFHCVIMDVNLPEMDGYEAAGLLKTIIRDTPIILTAEHNTPELETKIRERDVYYYHLRSFEQDELRLAVGSVFDGRLKAEKSKESEKSAPKPVRLRHMGLSL